MQEGRFSVSGEVLEQLEDPSLVLRSDLPKLEFLDIGHEFRLGMSFVKVFTSVPLEPNAKSRQLECSADLEFSQIDDSTGNPSTRGHSMLLPMLGTALECDLAHYEAKPH